eukprot:m.10792 g.10792  ORF g.10792 m.10792 type:complete len:64 (+) comp22677_c0_seq1:788-979(+)
MFSMLLFIGLIMAETSIKLVNHVNLDLLTPHELAGPVQDSGLVDKEVLLGAITKNLKAQASQG